MYKYMVVDDEELERKAIQIIIKKRELPLVCVAEASHGSEAVQKAAESNPDLVFMDIKMPGMNGIEAAREILRSQPQCRLVFLTAYDQFEYARKGLQMGASDYLLKPVRPDILEETCSKILEDMICNRQQIEEQKRLQKELENSQPIIQNALVYNLLCGNFYNYEKYKDKISSLNFNFNNAVVLVISAKKEDQSGLSGVNRVINELFEDKSYAIVIPMHQGKVALVIGETEEQPDLSFAGTKNMAEQINKELSAKSWSEVNIGIGRKYKLCDIGRSYSEASNAVNLADLLQGKNPVLHINECINYYADIPDYPYDIEKRLTDLVIKGDVNGSLECVGEMYLKIFQSFNQNFIWAKARCLQLLGVLSKAAADAGVSNEELFQANSTLFQGLLKVDEMEQLKSWLNDCATDITCLISRSRELSSHRVIKITQEYIEQNLNKNITLEDICKRVFLNSQYFSRLFKKETGMTFTEYLTLRRIEKAKVLLKSEGLPVAVVARKVGFSDANYFSRVFARIEGIPPSEFAKAILNTKKR